MPFGGGLHVGQFLQLLKGGLDVLARQVSFGVRPQLPAACQQISQLFGRFKGGAAIVRRDRRAVPVYGLAQVQRFGKGKAECFSHRAHAAPQRGVT